MKGEKLKIITAILHAHACSNLDLYERANNIVKLTLYLRKLAREKGGVSYARKYNNRYYTTEGKCYELWPGGKVLHLSLEEKHGIFRTIEKASVIFMEDIIKGCFMARLVEQQSRQLDMYGRKHYRFGLLICKIAIIKRMRIRLDRLTDRESIEKARELLLIMQFSSLVEDYDEFEKDRITPWMREVTKVP